MLDDHFQFKMFMFSIIINSFDGGIRLTSYLHLAHANVYVHMEVVGHLKYFQPRYLLLNYIVCIPPLM
jgi:hypothetical protein